VHCFYVAVFCRARNQQLFANFNFRRQKTQRTINSFPSGARRLCEKEAVFVRRVSKQGELPPPPLVRTQQTAGAPQRQWQRAPLRS